MPKVSPIKAIKKICFCLIKPTLNNNKITITNKINRMYSGQTVITVIIKYKPLEISKIVSVSSFLHKSSHLLIKSPPITISTTNSNMLNKILFHR